MKRSSSGRMFMNITQRKKYDLVICQAVLRHLDTPERFLKKMIEFAKQDAYIVCIDSNREFECDGLYVDGMDYFQSHPEIGYTFVKGTMISYGKK